MSRLPTVGGDTDNWGTVLNDYLTETASTAVLANSPTVGATSFDLAVVPTGLIVGSMIAIDAYTTECELAGGGRVRQHGHASPRSSTRTRTTTRSSYSTTARSAR